MSSSLLDIISVDSFHNGLPKYFQHIVTLFEQSRAFSHVADFARLALQPLESSSNRPTDHASEYNTLRTDLLSRLFHASLKTCQFEQAYSALSRYTDLALQKSALTSLITTMLSVSGPGTAGVDQLLSFPLSLTPNLFTHVDQTLVSLAKKQTSFPLMQGPGTTSLGLNHNMANTPDLDRTLYAYRIARHDFRGAAEVAYRIVQRLRKARDAPPMSSFPRRPSDHVEGSNQVDEDDPESKELRQELLALINLLACVERSNAYILVDVEDDDNRSRNSNVSWGGGNDGSVFNDSPIPGRKGSTSSPTASPVLRSDSRGGSKQQQEKRIVVTLEDLRREYQSELDRVSRIERGDYEFGEVEGDQVNRNESSHDFEVMNSL